MAEGLSEEKKSIAAALIQNTPLAIVVIGSFLAVLGAAGGWAKYGLAITEPGWRIAICLMGLVCAGMGLGLHQKRDVLGSAGEKIDAVKYGFRIRSPETNEAVGNRLDIKGTYQTGPCAGVQIWIVEFSPSTQKYYPKRQVIINEKEKTWESLDCHIRGNPKERRGLVVAAVGPAGQALCEYFLIAGDETKNWVGIRKLTPDIVECDHVTVKIKG
jgi:hypothetical protein